MSALFVEINSPRNSIWQSFEKKDCKLGIADAAWWAGARLANARRKIAIVHAPVTKSSVQSKRISTLTTIADRVIHKPFPPPFLGETACASSID
jgi:hypothetical protein